MPWPFTLVGLLHFHTGYTRSTPFVKAGTMGYKNRLYLNEIMNQVHQTHKGGVIMSTRRDAYVEKLKAQLDEWNAELDKLEAHARKADAEERMRYESQINTLREKEQQVKETLKQLMQAKDDAWMDLKHGVESAWSSFKSGLIEAKSEFKKGYRGEE